MAALAVPAQGLKAKADSEPAIRNSHTFLNWPAIAAYLQVHFGAPSAHGNQLHAQRVQHAN